MESTALLSAGQMEFATRVGASLKDALHSAVDGRVFVYVEERERTIRYELDLDGSVLRGDVFPRSRMLER